MNFSREQIETWMRQAMDLAEKGRGHVEPNPLVGCLILEKDQVIGAGWHEKFGDAHAEVNAIVQCARHGVSSVGTTIYTSFFPCNTCTLAIIQAGSSRVVSWKTGAGDEHWEQSISTSRTLLSEAGIDWCELERRQGEA